MIVLITEMYQSVDKMGYPDGKKELYVSHGVDQYTLNNIVLPFEPLSSFIKRYGAKFDKDLGDWFID